MNYEIRSHMLLAGWQLIISDIQYSCSNEGNYLYYWIIGWYYFWFISIEKRRNAYSKLLYNSVGQTVLKASV